MKSFKEYVEHDTSIWITPSGEVIDLHGTMHDDYVIMNPKKFNLSKKDITPTKIGQTEVLGTKLALNTGSVRIHLYRDQAIVVCLPEAYKRHRKEIFNLMIENGFDSFEYNKSWDEWGLDKGRIIRV